MQKNKFIHEDIKAVCNSATKKLIACGLVVAVNGGNIVNAQTKEFDAQKQLKKELQVEDSTAVGSVSNTANSQGNTVEQLLAARTSGPVASSTPVTQQMTPVEEQHDNNSTIVASEPTPEGNELNKPEEKKRLQLTEKKEMEVIAKGLGNYSSWGDLCADNNFAYGPCFFKEDTKQLMSLLNANIKEINEVLEKSEETYEKQQKQIKELQIEIDDQTIKISKKTAMILAYYEHNPDKGEWEFTGDNYLNIDDVSLQRFGDHSEKIETAANAYALRRRLDYLRERIRDYNRRLEGGLLSFVMYSQRYKQVEEKLQPQSPEPDRYNIDQAPAYVEWATDEVNRLEPLARIMLQQLRVGAQEQTDFEDRMSWFNPQWDLRMLPRMAATDSLDNFLGDSRQVTEMLQNLHRTMEEIIAFFSQPYESPFNNNQVQNDNNMINNNQIDIDDSITITREEFERNIPGNQLRGEGILVERPEHNNQIDDYQTQNDNNMINNNQIEEIVEIQEVVEEPEDLNMINNNQIEEIQEIQEVTNEQDNNNLINNNQQQQPILHIAPLNVPAPQQRNGIVGGAIKFIGNAVSFFNPFAKK